MDGRRKALIVANDQYEHDGLRHLLSPGADAEALGRVLGDTQIGGFEVRVVRNEPAHVIGTYIEDMFSDSRPDDVLLLHFSCHGLKNESGELFFAARNTRPNRLGSTAVSADFVQRCMRASRSRSIVLLLDCCYGGAFSQGVRVRASGDANVLDSFPGGELGGGRGRAVITASSAMEYAFEGDQLADDTARPPSVFTSTLVEGMATGEADRDEDGWISLNELYDYVFDRVREKNPNQTPSRDVEMQGELYLARSRRRRVRPQPIPPDLRAAMTHENMFSRLGAVTELRSRLTSEALPVAAGACEALREIAGTDIRYVADAATAALEEATIQPSERELHFGEVAVGADAGIRAVRLLGPPLARACTVQPSESWITVTDTAEGVAVSVATSRLGTHRGSLTLRGPTGEVLIPVDVQVTEPSPEPRSGGPAVAPASVSATPDEAAPRPSESTWPVTAAPSALAEAPAAPQIASPPQAQASPPQAQASPPQAQASPPQAQASPPQAQAPTSGPSPTAPPASGRPPWPGRIAVAILSAGVVTVLLGLILPTLEGDEAKIGAIAIQIAVYGAAWVLLACAPGEATLGRRIILAVLGGWALLILVALVADFPQYLEYWKIPETPLYLFWLVAGALEIGAALLGGTRPTRRLELVSGTLTAILGLLIIYIVNQQWSGLVVSFSLYFVTLGAVWVLIGLTRRRAIRAG
jgi:hypothetical protein